MLLTQDEIKNACRWLLKNSGPSIRYRTLTEIMHKPYDDSDVQAAYAEILSSNRFKYISAKQNTDGSFGEKSFHGHDTSESYIRELFELGVNPEHVMLKKGVEYVENLCVSQKDISTWIVGLLTEPIGRAGKNQLVLDWLTDYTEKFINLYNYHRKDWLITKRGNPSTYYLEIPYIYVIRTLSYSWWWLKEAADWEVVSKILEFLLVDMAEVDKLYWIAPNNPKVSYPNFLHIVTSDSISMSIPSVYDFVISLEGLWLLAEFGIIEKYPNLLNCFKFVSSKKNNDGLWEFPVQGVTKSKSMWHAYHGFSLEEDWRRKEAPIAELTFRICLTAEKNRNGKA